MNIVLVGAGRLSTNLGLALHQAGIAVSQVYSRTAESAQRLANAIGAEATHHIDSIDRTADCYIVALTDNALIELIPTLTRGREDALWVHTAGSIPIDVWKPYAHHYGVFYPMQTFSLERTVDFSHLPIFIEGGSDDDSRQLEDLARCLSDNVRCITSEQRCILHLAAVLVCNFTNHLYDLADRLLQDHQLPFDVMLPLIDETAAKVHHLTPHQAQTGPAIRGDTRVINAHLQLLDDYPQLKQLYEQMSENIEQQRIANSE